MLPLSGISRGQWLRKAGDTSCTLVHRNDLAGLPQIARVRDPERTTRIHAFEVF